MPVYSHYNIKATTDMVIAHYTQNEYSVLIHSDLNFLISYYTLSFMFHTYILSSEDTTINSRVLSVSVEDLPSETRFSKPIIVKLQFLEVVIYVI